MVMVCQQEQEVQQLVQKVCDLYDQISGLDSLKPSKHVNALFTELVLTCMPPSPIDVAKLTKRVQEIRAKLIRLCGHAEGLLESHYSTVLAQLDAPLDHLTLFPYYSNYLKLGFLEFTILSQHYPAGHVPTKIAFVGSGPLPLTSIVLATQHLTSTVFHNYDLDPAANAMALALVSSDADLTKRMVFHTTDIMEADPEVLEDYEVVFLAALVGMDSEEKLRIIEHLANHMAPGALLMLRSAHGARAFLYPVVDPCELRGFEVLSVFHPTDEVINSVVVARKHSAAIPSKQPDHQQPGGVGVGLKLPNKCSEIVAFNPLISHRNKIEELMVEEQLS